MLAVRHGLNARFPLHCGVPGADRRRRSLDRHSRSSARPFVPKGLLHNTDTNFAKFLMRWGQRTMEYKATFVFKRRTDKRPSRRELVNSGAITILP